MELYEKYFSINLKDYYNIGLDLDINKLLLAFLVAIIAAIIAISIIKSAMYTIIRTLMRHEANCEDNAKTLAELGLDKPIYKSMLKSNSQLGRIIEIVGKTEYTYEEYSALIKKRGFKDDINFEEAKLYIKEDARDDAGKIFDMKKPTVIETVLLCILMVAISACLMFFMPTILTLINNWLG
jgi:ABC-type dipeptide/oligopeptide/nickel transport system permease component